MKNTPQKDNLFNKISDLIEQSRSRVLTAINSAEVYTKYAIGQYIVEYEQQGEERAQYGKQVLQDVSERLTEKFGKGWSVEILKLCRLFYQIYSPKIVNTVYDFKKFQKKKKNKQLAKK
ncbi:MAG: hypothetical protein IJ566_03100 [Cardiobacteriaceae bacterium]|nr:hypothetical protein [Cardiobacteriaceae bacterium]